MASIRSSCGRDGPHSGRVVPACRRRAPRRMPALGSGADSPVAFFRVSIHDSYLAFEEAAGWLIPASGDFRGEMRFDLLAGTF